MADTLADRILDARRRNDWTQAQVAEWAGVDVTALSRWESGQRVPDAANCVRLARGLRVTLDWLLGADQGPTEAA